MLSIVGKRSLGKSYLAKEIAARLYSSGRMKFAQLRYTKLGGFVQGIRDLISPQEEEIKSLIHRIEQQFLQSRGIHPQQKSREATALALWSHFNSVVEVQIGLVFLLQQLRDEGCFCLLLEQPQRSQLSGDGLELCISILSKAFGSFPVLILAVIDEEEIGEGTPAEQKLKHLARLGAERIDLAPLSPAAMTSHLQGLVLENVERWRAIVGGYSGRLHTLLQHPYPISWKDSWQKTLYGTLIVAQEEAGFQLLIILSLSSAALPRYALKAYAEELDLLLTQNVLKERGRWIYFLRTELRAYFQRQGEKKHYIALAQVWTLAKHEDPHIRNLSWAAALIAAGDQQTPLPLLLKSIRQALDFGRTDVAYWGTQIGLRVQNQPSFSESLHLLFFRVLLRQRSYRTLQDKIEDFLAGHTCSLAVQETIQKIQLAASIQERRVDLPVEQRHRLASEHSDQDLLWLKGSYDWICGNHQAAKKNFLAVMQGSSPKDTVWGDGFCKYLELNFQQRQHGSLQKQLRQFLFQAKQLASLTNVAHSSLSKGQWSLQHGKRGEALQSFQLSASISLLSGKIELWWRASCFMAATLLWDCQFLKAREIFDLAVWQARSLQSTYYIRMAQLQYVSTFCQDREALCARLKRLSNDRCTKEEDLYYTLLCGIGGLASVQKSMDWSLCRDPAMILPLLVYRQHKKIESVALETLIDRLIFYVRRDDVPLFTFLQGKASMF